MTMYKYQGIEPKVGKDVFIAKSADVIGNVDLGDNTSIWFNTVIRGDIEPITIGENTNIQDLSMLHTSEGFPLTIGKNVTVGHSVTLHACTVGDNCLIGMGATVLDGAVIGENSLVAAGSVVPPGKEYPAGYLIIGSPAKAIKKLSDEKKHIYGNHYKGYLQYKDEFLKDHFEEISE